MLSQEKASSCFSSQRANVVLKVRQRVISVRIWRNVNSHNVLCSELMRQVVRPTLKIFSEQAVFLIGTKSSSAGFPLQVKHCTILHLYLRSVGICIRFAFSLPVCISFHPCTALSLAVQPLPGQILQKSQPTKCTLTELVQSFLVCQSLNCILCTRR